MKNQRNSTCIVFLLYLKELKLLAGVIFEFSALAMIMEEQDVYIVIKKSQQGVKMKKWKKWKKHPEAALGSEG